MPLHSTALRYLPHLASREILRMGLKQAHSGAWIETDADIGRYHRHKLALRETLDKGVYRSSPESLPAQQELASLLYEHLLQEQSGNYLRKGEMLFCAPGDFCVPVNAAEPLWNTSLLVADDLLLMQKLAGSYRLTAASLCSPSHWSLAEKFSLPIRGIHDPIPGFHHRLSPSIDRFFDQLRPGPHFERFNWSLQADDELAQFPGAEETAAPATPLFYRVERQTLKRLPASDAIIFTIRVYLHPLEALQAVEGALPELLDIIRDMPPALASYKGLDRLGAALLKYGRA